MFNGRRSASLRRIFAGTLALILTAALMFIPAPAAKAASSRINSMDITCRIDVNGDAVITEVIDIDAYQGTEYYQVVNVRGNQQVRDLVVSENGITKSTSFRGFHPIFSLLGPIVSVSMNLKFPPVMECIALQNGA